MDTIKTTGVYSAESKTKEKKNISAMGLFETSDQPTPEATRAPEQLQDQQLIFCCCCSFCFGKFILDF